MYTRKANKVANPDRRGAERVLSAEAGRSGPTGMTVQTTWLWVNICVRARRPVATCG